MLRICCVKWGDKYSAEYANILRDMIARNLPEGFPGEFVCFTDDATGLDPAIGVRPLPDGVTGWFNKIYLFKDGLFDDGDRILFMDLDTVIVGALDQIVTYDGPFAILRDFYRKDGLQSSAMAWSANTLGFVWNEFETDGFPSVVGGDQAWIEFFRDNGKLNPEIWQNLFPKAFVSFKADCQPMPPRAAKVVVFHGEPRPHNCDVEWVKGVWAIDGGQGFDLEQICNTADAKIAANVRYANALDLPWLERVAPHHGHAVIVGGAPSLKDKIEEIRWRKAIGAVIFATNNTARMLQDHGIGVDNHILLDARPENVEFLCVNRAGGRHYIASQCDRGMFEALEGDDATVWHPLVPLIQEMVHDDPRAVHLVGCGSTVCLKAIGIAHCLGYRTFHLFGMDSSYTDGAHHAYPQALNDADRVLDVRVGERLFKAAPWMVSQANEFQDLAAYLANEGCTITVSGDGLLPHVARMMMLGGPPAAADLRASAILSELPDGPVVGAEIGVFAGDLSSRLLQRPDLTLYMVDSWRGSGADYQGDSGDWHAGLTQERQSAYMAHTIAAVAFAKDRAKVMAMSSQQAAAVVPDGSLDFVFIDADHSYEGCARDIALWLPKLKPSGILSGHDYENKEFPKFGVKRAVDEFGAFHSCEIRLGENFTWFISNIGLRKAA